MRFLLPFTFVSAALALSPQRGTPSNCKQATIPVTVTAHPRVISLSTPKNQSEVIGFFTSLTSVNSTLAADVVHDPTTLNATYNIWTLLCLPPKGKADILEFAVHGINYDHNYWNFGGEGSPYNYVDAAVGAGHAIFIYDRLGTGQSSRPDGIKEVQEDTEVEVAAQLIRYIKGGKTGHEFQQVIGIGHSFGSIQLNVIAARYPELLNATILTGFSPYTGTLNTAIVSFGLTIASIQNHTRFGSVSNSYVTTGTLYGDQAVFFYFPFFDPNVLLLASSLKQTSTIGEYLTLNASVAEDYTNPVLVVTGAKDNAFCGGDCLLPFGGFDNLVQYSQILFPKASSFNYSIPANTGHAVNLHYNAPEVFNPAASQPEMRFFIPLAVLSMVSSSFQAGVQSNCHQSTIAVNVTAHPSIINLAPPKDQVELTGIITNFTSIDSNITADVVHGQTTLKTTYNIWTLLCLPPNAKPSVVEFAVHGINFDHSYWIFGGDGSPYNYADVALKAGHAIFIYDRLGVGQSSRPDGIKEVQEDTQIEVAAELIKYIRSGKTGHEFRKFVGVSHSFGSAQLSGVAAKYPELLDAMVLTGFTSFSGALNTAWTSFGLTIAAVQNHTRFGSLSTSYLATGTISNDQQPFLLYPFFDRNVLIAASETKQTSTVGEYLTIGAHVANNYTNPVLIVTGERDFIFCGADCYQKSAGFDNLVQASGALFPNSRHFSYNIPANVGHGVNLHLGAPEVFKTIQTWISEVI
ncbi:hypothetical protein CVT26_015386 [Gymnopilus dilepis]|uniref:AB hydrolase-1 domain-containing protein n=1 Tax=Gymnopilus dilepis TaxID=231916 RepID=A0A409WCZ5_9AGAR|nr:hypothetical protein CVT26_015386 [Gymnopilus dilepis]